MVQIMQVVKKQQQGPVLKLIFSLAQLPSSLGFGAEFEEQVSEIFNVNDLAEVRFQCKSQSSNTFYNFSYKKHELAADNTIKMNISCKNLQYSKQCNCPEHFTGWVKMGEIRHEPTYSDRSSNRVQYNFWSLNVLEVTLSACKVQAITFAKLYEDEEFCDFHLMTIDGVSSVPVHKACIALHSDMFRRMLNGEWKETINGCIKIEGVNLQSLRHLKEYFYLGRLPNDTKSLQPLLLLAKCYMIDNLMTECTTKMAEIVRPEDMFSLQQFAVDNRIPELLRAVLQYTPARTFQCAHLMATEDGGPSEVKKKKSDDENL